MSEIQINSNGHNIDAELATERICRGIRGATTVEENSVEAILSATRELLYIIIRANEIDPDDVASAIFTTTADLNATYPALAARQLGWYDTRRLTTLYPHPRSLEYQPPPKRDCSCLSPPR
jgi:hypothetical protein